MRLNLATDIKTRTGAPDKDARQKNSYIEVKNEQPIVRKRPCAQGGVSVGTGTAQGGYGLVLFWSDIAYPITEATGTDWSGATPYVIGDHVSVGFVDYWALADNTNSQPPSSNWSRSRVPPVGSLTSWTVGTLLKPSSITNHAIAYSGSLYVYLAINPATEFFYSITSTNGLSWTVQADSNLMLIDSYNIIYGGGVFLCAGTTIGGTGETATSVDGINWTVHTNILTGDFRDFEWNGSVFVGILTTGEVYTSPDGYTWTLRTSLGTSAIWAIAWNGNAFAITTDSTTSAYSATGTSWTLASLPSAKSWTSIKANGTIFCAVETNGNYAVSTNNGATWSEGATGLSNSGAMSSGNGIFLATLSLPGVVTNYATSANGTTWTIRNFPVGGSWTNSIYGSKFVVIGTSTYCATSSTGL